MPIKLLFYTGASGYEESGTVWLTDEQVRKWASLGLEFDATLLAVEVDRRRRRTAAAPRGVSVVWTSARSGISRLLPPPSALAAMWRHIRSVDAFLTFMPEVGGIAPLCLALVARRPRYMLVQATSPHFRSWDADGVLSAVASRLAMNCLAIVSTGVFVNGADLKREFIPPLRHKCVEVVMSTLTADDFHEPTALDSRVVRLLTVSRLVRNKRVDVVMRATRLLLDRGVDARLTLLGEGPLQGDLLRLAHELNLGDRFEFRGLVDNPETLRRHYAEASMFVLCSETEGISLAVQEAMAAGTPVIVTAPGGMASFLEPGHDSIVVSEPDPAAFADAIQELANSPDSYLRIARAALKKVRSISNRRWAQQLERIISRDLGNRIRSRPSPTRE